jgi:hypothetical protein
VDPVDPDPQHWIGDREVEENRDGEGEGDGEGDGDCEGDVCGDSGYRDSLRKMDI